MLDRRTSLIFVVIDSNTAKTHDHFYETKITRYDRGYGNTKYLSAVPIKWRRRKRANNHWKYWLSPQHYSLPSLPMFIPACSSKFHSAIFGLAQYLEKVSLLDFTTKGLYVHSAKMTLLLIFPAQAESHCYLLKRAKWPTSHTYGPRPRVKPLQPRIVRGTAWLRRIKTFVQSQLHSFEKFLSHHRHMGQIFWHVFWIRFTQNLLSNLPKAFFEGLPLATRITLWLLLSTCTA